MQSRSARLASWAVATLALFFSAMAVAQEQGLKQITGPKPDSRASIRLFLDPDLKREHTAKNIPAPGTKFPRPVLEEAPNGALRTLVEVSGGMAEVWLDPREVKTGLKTDGNCLVAQRSTGPIGATRGANEGCGGLKK